MGGMKSFNLETLELWLGAYAGGYDVSRDHSEANNNPNKQGSKMPINVLWMEALRDPNVRETDEILRGIIFEEMRDKRGIMTFSLFEYLYLREHSNPAEAEEWRTSTDKLSKLRYKMLVKGKTWILGRVEELHPGFVLTVPDPINPKGFLKQSHHAQRVAKRVYFANVDEYGVRGAAGKAAKASGYSERHVRRIVATGYSRHEKEVEACG